MLHLLPGPINGVISLLLLAANTVVCCTPLFIIAFFKLAVPAKPWRRLCDKVLNAIAQGWVGFNNFILGVTKKIRWQIEGLEGLKANGWYLVLSNHQTWTDIVVLQKIFSRKIPFLKFFLKKELIYVPVLGVAWWALDFPFMKRYSRATLAKKPHLAGKDVETTIKACAKFKTIPISIMNFVEGTRFSPTKHQRQKSPFKNLLRPKAGGAALVMAAMGEQLHKILDVTIVYPEGVKSFWAFLCGKVTDIRVKINAVSLSAEQLGASFNDPAFRHRFEQWLNTLWQEKDRRIDEMRAAVDQFAATQDDKALPVV